jgi:TRAP-type C4-dicarboxylate transport system permease small subunit
MKKVLRKIEWVIEGLSSVTGGVAALCIVAAAIIVTEGIITRKIFGLSDIWQIETAVFILIFSTFVGAPFVQKTENHLNVDLILIILPPKIRELSLIIVSFITCILVGIVTWFSWPMWWEAYDLGWKSESLWAPPLWIPYFFLPFGMSLLLLQHIVHIIRKIDSLKKGKIIEEVTRVELKDIEIPGTNLD